MPFLHDEMRRYTVKKFDLRPLYFAQNSESAILETQGGMPPEPQKCVITFASCSEIGHPLSASWL